MPELEPQAKRQKTENGDPSEGHFTEHFTNPTIDNLRIKEIKALAHPQLIMEEYEATDTCTETVRRARREASNCILGNDDRVVVVVGPASIHDPKGAIEYAKRLKCEAERFKSDLVILMRVYFEKPDTSTTTTTGWKGFVADPYLDGSYRVNDGLRICRKLLRDINDLGMPCASEFPDVLTPQYFSDLVSWTGVGARTSECQGHRELASGLSMPVGFNNNTSGDIDVAIDAVISAKHPHCFFNITKHGTAAIVHSNGNAATHVVLRGGKPGPNYDERSVGRCVANLEKKGIKTGIMIDCSRGNSAKKHENQPKVLDAINEQIRAGAKICGVMIESNLFAGRQDLPSKAELEAAGIGGGSQADVLNRLVGAESPVIKAGLLRHGISITEECVDWCKTIEMLEPLAQAVRDRRRVMK